MKNLLFVLIAAASLAFSGHGQSEDVLSMPNPRVLSQMTAPSCEYVMANLDAAGVELQNNPQDTLFAIIYPAGPDMRYAKAQAKSIDGWVKGRRFDRSRIIIAFGPKRDQLSVEFIMVPIGAKELPVERVWTRSSPFDAVGTPAKATLIATETVDEDPCAYKSGYLEDLGAYLKANPEATARIVIKTASRAGFNQEAIGIRSELAEQYGIPAKRIRIVYRRSAQWPKAPFSETEYWLMPAARPK